VENSYTRIGIFTVLRNQNWKDLFIYCGQIIPSSETCRRYLKDLYEEEILRIKYLINKKDVFLILDESCIQNVNIVNVIIGPLDNPNQYYLIDSRTLDEAPNNSNIFRIINETTQNLGIDGNNLKLILTDAARYMTAMTPSLKLLYPQIFHVTCLAHLVHNCSVKISEFFTKTNKLIAAVKDIVVRSKKEEIFCIKSDTRQNP